MIMQYEGSMVRAQYCSEWTELGLWYGTLVRFLCSEMIDEGATSIVCGFGQEGQAPELCGFITLLKY